MADETKRYLINIESNLAKYSEDAAKAKEKVDELRVSNEQLKESGKASASEIEASNAALRNAQKEYNQAKKLVDLQTQANNSNINSRKQLGAIVELEKYKLGQLSNTIKINKDGTRSLSDEYKKQVKALADAKQAVINYDKAQNDGRSNIGRYGETVSQSFKSMGSSMLSALGPAALLATGLNQLKEAFLSTDAGAKAQKKWSEGIKAFFRSVISGDLQMAGVKALAAAEVAGKMAETKKGDREDTVKIAELETEIEKLTFESSNNLKSEAEQKRILLTLQEKENELIAYKKADLLEDLNNVQLMMGVSGETTALLDEEARIKAEIVKLEGEHSLRIQKRLTTLQQKELEAAQKEKERKEKEAQEQVEALDKFMEATRKANEENRKRRVEDRDEEIQAALDQSAREQEIRMINEENLFQIKQSRLNNEFELQRNELERQRQLEVANAEQTGADIAIINQKYAEFNRILAENERDARLAIYGDFAGSIAQLFGEQTAIGKAAAIAQSTISTYQAAAKALAAYPPPFSYIAAAGAIAYGLANVQKIVSVKSGLPGEGSKGNQSAPTAISAPRATAQQVGPTILQVPQLTQMQLNALPNTTNVDMSDKIIEGIKNIKVVTTIEDINAKQNSTNKVTSRANI